MTPPHSPLPWLQNQGGHFVWSERGPRIVCDCSRSVTVLEDEAIANAAMIVTAVNNYEKMSKALKEIAQQKLCDEMNPNDDIEQYGDFEGAYDMMIKVARAALAGSDT